MQAVPRELSGRINAHAQRVSDWSWHIICVRVYVCVFWRNKVLIPPCDGLLGTKTRK